MMETETVLPVYTNDFHRYGSLTSNDIQDDGLKRLMVCFGPVAVTAEQSTRLSGSGMEHNMLILDSYKLILTLLLSVDLYSLLKLLIKI